MKIAEIKSEKCASSWYFVCVKNNFFDETTNLVNKQAIIWQNETRQIFAFSGCFLYPFAILLP